MRKIEIIQGDCMEVMAQYPDKYFDLAVVDPPYGIGRDGGETGKNWKRYKKKEWDIKRPSKQYFQDLFRVSQNQIIWGANYFTEFLPPSMGWIFWDKGQELTMSDGEFAFSSYQMAARRKTLNRCYIGANGGLIHPTQKPVALYDWIYQKYLPEGGKVLDTHGGSMSNVISWIKAGNIDGVCTEKDVDHFNDAKKRIQAYLAQQDMFREPIDVKFVQPVLIISK